MEFIFQFQCLKRPGGFGERISGAPWIWNVAIETRSYRAQQWIRCDPSVLSHVNNSGCFNCGLMCSATRLDYRYRRNWTISLCIDFEDVAMLLAVESFNYFFARDPRVWGTNTAGAVG